MHNALGQAATQRPFLLAVGTCAVIACHARMAGAQVVQTAPAPPFAVRLIEVAEASASGLGASAASGVILEIENAEPGLALTLDTISVTVKTTSGAVYHPSLMFYVNILKGRVEPSSIAGTQLQGKTIQVGDTKYEAFSSMATMAVAMQEGGGMMYTFEDLAVLQLGFVFPVARASLASLDFVKQPISLTRSALDLAGTWEAQATWPELTFAFDANVDKNSMFLSNAKVVVECKSGTPATKAELTSNGRARINQDGTVQVTFGETGATLTGKFVPGAMAVEETVSLSGEMRGTLSAQCGTKWVKVVGKWTGRRRSH
jgi:hypothetical protein